MLEKIPVLFTGSSLLLDYLRVWFRA